MRCIGSDAQVAFCFYYSLFLYSIFSSRKKTDDRCSAGFTPQSRFQSLYRMLKTADKSLPKSPSDTLLYSDKEFVMIPTLGSLTLLYVLFISKKLFFNFAQASAGYGHKPIPAIAKILLENFDYAGDFIWFEHGATASGIVPGSNVDHGHIHIILKPKFTFQSFYEKAISMDKRIWKSVAAVNAYDKRNGDQDYLVFGDKNIAFWTYLDTPKIPQFFRRVVAELVGRNSEWNYREFPHQEMAAKTVSFMQQRLRGRYNFTTEAAQHKMMKEWEREVSFCQNIKIAFPFKSLSQYIKQNLFKQKNSYCIGGNSCQNIPFVLFKPAG